MHKTCCFTGHRPNGLPWKYDEQNIFCLALKKMLASYIKQKLLEGYTHFISGMAMGVDLIAAECVLQLKEDYNISLEAAIPCENQCKFWSETYVQRYNKILEQCDKITYISKTYTKNCMWQRNCYMVDNSDCVIAVSNGNKQSGTAQTINYAKQKGKEILLIRL